MILDSIHLAPNAPWIALAVISVAMLVLGVWAYRFGAPPLPVVARRALSSLRVLALLALAWLLAQPVLERARAGGGARVTVLVDGSRSMDLPEAADATQRRTRAAAAEVAVEELRRGFRGRAEVSVVPFAGALGVDSTWLRTRGASAPGMALEALARSPEGQSLDGVVVVSDGAANAGADPVAAARALGVPVHAVLVGRPVERDRAVVEVQGSTSARVGERTPVRVRITSTEPAGAAIPVRLMDGDRELARATAVAPGGGAEATAEFRVTPTKRGLAVWTAAIDSLPGEISAINNARQVAIEVAPGRLGVLVLSGGLNWDLTFMRRAWLGDSGLQVSTRMRSDDGWRDLESNRRVGTPGPDDLRGQAVVVLDGMHPAEVGPEFDRAVAGFIRAGGGLLAIGGSAPGVLRYRGGALGTDLAPEVEARPPGAPAAPEPAAEASDLLAWDDDPARGERAWRAAAPLLEIAPVAASAGDRVLVRATGDGPPLLWARRVGRGQALLVNGTGLWRWSLSSHDELAAERGRRLWRRIARWLAEPVQGEPLRVRPERWLAAHSEPVRLFASLQDESFRPIGGASIEAEAREADGRAVPIRFESGATGSYVTMLHDLPPGRYTVTARATRGGRELGRATTEFAVDRWSLEEARTDPDSAVLAAMTAASGGRLTTAPEAGRWARGVGVRALARARTDSVRLWESPWIFAAIVGALSIEWIWRRRRGLP